MQNQSTENQSPKKVVIIGAGGHGRVIADIVSLAGDVVLGFLDDKDPSEFPNITILGKLTDIERFKQEASFIVGIEMEVFSDINDKMNRMTWPNFRKKFLQDTLNSLENLITNSFYQPAIDWIKDGLKAFCVIRDQLLGQAEMSSMFCPYDWNWLVSVLSLGYPVYKVEPDTIAPPEFFILGNRQLSASVRWGYLDGLIRFLNFLGIEDRDGLFCPFYTSCRSTEKESCSDDPIRLYGLGNCQFQHYMSIFNLEEKQLIDPTGSPIKLYYSGKRYQEEVPHFPQKMKF